MAKAKKAKSVEPINPIEEKDGCVLHTEDSVPNGGIGAPFDEPLPEVYGVTNTEEGALEQQEAAGIPDETKHHYEYTTSELINIIASRQTDKMRERKVLRLLREKLK